MLTLVGAIAAIVVVSAIALTVYEALVPTAAVRRFARERPILPLGDWQREMFPLYTNNEATLVQKLAHITATVIGLDPSQLRPKDSLWEDYFRRPYLLNWTSSSQYEALSDLVIEFVERTRKRPLSDEEVAVAAGWETLEDLFGDVMNWLR